MKPLAILLLYSAVIVVTSCSSTRTSAPSAIGIMPLTQFTLKSFDQVTDTTWMAFTNQVQFDAVFNSTAPDAKRPDFNAQTVVAMILKSAPSTPMTFEKMEIAGNSLNVYAATCLTPTQTNCTQNQVIMAATAKSGNVKRVQFFMNGVAKRTIGL